MKWSGCLEQQEGPEQSAIQDPGEQREANALQRDLVDKTTTVFLFKNWLFENNAKIDFPI